MIKQLYVPVTYEFDSKGNYTINYPMGKITGLFEIKNDNIRFHKEWGKFEDCSLSMNDQVLYLEIKPGDTPIKLGMSRF